MSIRIDTASLVPGIVCGHRGLGVLGSVVLAETATGSAGPGLGYPDVDPGDENKEFQFVITAWPAAGTLFVHENGALDYVPAGDGTYSLTYEGRADGVVYGTRTVPLIVGASTSALSSIVLESAAGTASGTGTISGQADSQLAAVLTSGIGSVMAAGIITGDGDVKLDRIVGSASAAVVVSTDASIALASVSGAAISGLAVNARSALLLGDVSSTAPVRPAPPTPASRRLVIMAESRRLVLPGDAG